MMRLPTNSRRRHLQRGGRRVAAAPVAVLAILALTVLAGCNLFYQSPFPGFVPLIENQVDISDRFPYDPAAEYRMELVNGGEGDYIVIIAAGPELGERLAIYDADLEERFYRKDSPTANEFDSNSPVIIDTTPNLYVGLLEFGPGLSGPLTNPGTVTLEGENNLFLAPSDYVSVQRSSPDEVNFRTSTPTIDVGPADNFVSVGLFGDLETVTSEYSLATDYFGFAAFDRNSQQLVVWVRPLTGWALPVVDIVSEPESIVFSISAGFVRDISVTADGVIVEDDEDGPILRFYDLAGNEGESLSLREHDSRYAFSAAGTHFYLLRSEDEKLVKADTWW